MATHYWSLIGWMLLENLFCNVPVGHTLHIDHVLIVTTHLIGFFK